MNDITDSRSRLLIGLGLAALMAATRGQFFAPLAHHLPDASLAVFFLGGFYLRHLGGFVALFLLATVLDLTAIGWGGVSGYCLTEAYWMLVPAYGVVWGAGRWYAGSHTTTAATLPVLAGALLVGGIAAEVLSSGGFYLLSGRFADLSLTELLGRFATYMPATLMSLVAYVGLVTLAHLTLVGVRSSSRAERVHPQ
jgi:hypothetical protein